MVSVDVDIKYVTSRKLIDPSIFARHMSEMLEDEQEQLQTMWKGLATRHIRSGKYWRSITKRKVRTKFIKSSGTFTAIGSVFADRRIAPHAHFFEYGTGIYRKGGGRAGTSKWIYPKVAKNLVFFDSRPLERRRLYILPRVRAQRSHELGKMAYYITANYRKQIRKKHLAIAVAEQKAKLHG